MSEIHRKKKLVTCIDCGTTWSIRADRRSSRCRECGVKWLNKTKPINKVGPQNPLWKGGWDKCKKDRAMNNRIWALIYKGNKCQVCGINNLVSPCYHFHHLVAKDKKMQQYLLGSKEKLKIELDKCILLCANCHITLHHNNGTFGNRILGC